MGRAPCCDKTSVKKGPWSPEEDAKLKDYIDTHGTGGNWIALPHKAGLKRCGKSCRLRWLNYLRPNIKHGDFSDDEDRKICTLFATIGSRWSIIAAQLPGRTDNDIKNYWNTKLKKKLLGNYKIPNYPFGSTDFSVQNPFLTSSSSSPQIHSSYDFNNPGRFVETPIQCFPTPYDPISPTFCGLIPPNCGGSDGFLCPNFTQAAYPNSSCSSSDGSSCVINAAQDFAFDAYSSNGGETTRTTLDHSIDEIKQLITTTTNSNLNFFVMDEVKTEDQFAFDSDC